MRSVLSTNTKIRKSYSYCAIFKETGIHTVKTDSDGNLRWYYYLEILVHFSIAKFLTSWFKETFSQIMMWGQYMHIC